MMREKIGERPYEVTKTDGKYTIKFYPMIKNAKKPNKVLFCLTVTKKEFDGLASKIR
ncbi:hypothetical protein CENSYa_0642 [Cenarchaeum symbiosum A]|uniref:Uncharacterized protein n=1 Tax=Cenarchaeum symbiosum (strain A) TaxID=414004 RepID=A0RVA8_CENSY|nr:hypothetical protein CENSYa_0642 [Cenarchaeum symbiosum A]